MQNTLTNTPLKSWRLGLLGTSLALAVSLAPATARAESVLTSVNISDIRTTSPLEDSDGPTFDAISHVLEGLVAFDDSASIVPMLAQTYDISADGQNYTFHLREGVKFHNGETLTADDVAFAWKAYLDENSGWRCKPDFTGKGPSKIVSIESPDSNTVVFHLDKPWALFLGTMARLDCLQSGIFHRDSLGADGKWINAIGTGPFSFGEWRHSEYLDLVAFEAYSAREEPKTGLGGNKSPLVDRVRLLTIPDTATARAALIKGDLDVIPTLQPADMKELQGDAHVVVKGAPGFGLAGVLFGLQPSPFDDLRVRQALAHSLDYKAIAGIAMQGLVPANNSPVPTTSPFYDDVTATMHSTDVDLAKSLLVEAGYKGEPITLTTNNRDPFALQSSVMIQAMAKQAGITIEIETLEFGAYISRYLEGDYQIAVMGYGARLDPALTIDSFAGDRTVEKRKPWNDPAALKLLYESMQVSDIAARQEIFDELHHMFLDTVPMIILFNTATAYAVRDDVEGYSAWAGATPRFWGISKSEAN